MSSCKTDLEYLYLSSSASSRAFLNSCQDMDQVILTYVHHEGYNAHSNIFALQVSQEVTDHSHLTDDIAFLLVKLFYILYR